MTNDQVKTSVMGLMAGTDEFNQFVEIAVADFTKRLANGASDDDILASVFEGAVTDPDFELAIGVMAVALIRLARAEQRKQLTLERLGRSGLRLPKGKGGV